MNKERKVYLDICKGILIILVVLAHSSNTPKSVITTIFWFHMPAFFILSGIVSKVSNQKQSTLGYFKKMATSFFVPYFSYYFIVAVITRTLSINDIAKFLYGGRMYIGVWWFISCLFLTIVIFTLLNKHLSKKAMIILLLGFYILAHIESIYYLPNQDDYLTWSMLYNFPLSIDTCLLSVVYFSLGFYFKDIVSKASEKTSFKHVLLTSLICISFIGMNRLGVFQYSLNMKIGNYRNIILDIVIPVLFTTWILVISNFIANKLGDKISKILSFLGQNTLPIMYLHMPINSILQHRLNYGAIGYTVIGILLPIGFSYFCSKNNKLTLLFLGINQKSIIKSTNYKVFQQ